MIKKIVPSVFLIAGSFGVNANSQVELKTAFKDAFKIGVAVNQNIVTGKNAAAQSIIAKQFNAYGFVNHK